ncbi:hypothetical protein EV426DRAFT_267272 [Tirmania nivea]|nr:hypothetical protein EV426DRAFT_267272 [Tirmania nivea]
MLPTPTTAHLTFSHIYTPSEDTYLLLDTLSSPSQTTFLSQHFPSSTPTPLVLEIGSGSGIITSFITSHALTIFSRADLLLLTTDISHHASLATPSTVLHNPTPPSSSSGLFLDSLTTDLSSPMRQGVVDVLIFNPPYVPTDTLPSTSPTTLSTLSTRSCFEEESYYLELTYAGGEDGMETTNRLLEGLDEALSPRGVLYLLLCAQNRPEQVAERLRAGGYGKTLWKVEKVGSSGLRAGWEVLSIWRVWR